MRCSFIGIVSACALWAPACSTTATAPASVAPTATELQAGGGLSEPGTVWDYLLAKYDGDGDGRVAAAEYDRGSETFARLDKNGDGSVTEADFERADDHGPAMTPERMVPMILSRAYQQDDDPALTRDELARAFASLDADHDGALQEAEAASAYSDLRSMMDMDFHAMLVSAADGNGNGELSEFELLLLFDRLDEDSDGALRPMMGQHGPGSRQGSQDAGDVETNGEPPPAAAAGQLAPDFALRPVSGDGATVQLSAFQGDRPVALIFGSYT